MRTVVGGKDDEGVFCDPEVFESFAKVADVVVHAADEGGKALFHIGPAVPDARGVVGMAIGIDGAGRGVDHVSRSSNPLHASGDTEALVVEII